MGYTAIENKEVWLSLAGGSQAAFRQIYDHYQSQVYKGALHVLKDHFMAEELVQDVFVTLWEKREMLVTIDNPSAFLYTVAKNKTLNLLKLKAKIVVTDEDIATLNIVTARDVTAERIIDKDNQRIFQYILNLLTPNERQVFSLAKMEDKSYQEIAELLEVSELTVKTQMASSLRKIRKYLEKTSFLMFWTIVVYILV